MVSKDMMIFKSNKCLSIEKLLNKYFDQEATQEEISLIEGHINNCPNCQVTLKTMGEIRDAVKNPVEEALKRETFPWVWEKIEREIRLKEKARLWENLLLKLEICLLYKRRVLIPALSFMVILILIMSQLFFKKPPSHIDQTVVEYIESKTYNVMVYEFEKSEITVIWLFEGIGNGASTS